MSRIKQIIKKFIPQKYHVGARRLYYKIRSLPNIGADFFCLYYEVPVRRFLPFGLNARPNALCPYCGSLERHRLFLLYLKNETDIFSGKLKVLHFAPEFTIKNVLGELPNLTYTTTDLASNQVSVKSDIMKLPFEDGSFDTVLCSHVLEHVHDDICAMEEIFRILKPGAWAIIQVPLEKNREHTYEDPSIVSPEERERVFGQFDHVRIYGLDYEDRLKKAGFDVTIIDYAGQLGPDMIKKYGLSTDESIYYCAKPS